MKVAIIADTHFGVRNDLLPFLDYQKRFLADVFFPALRSWKIDTVIHLGDLVDRRKYINFQTVRRMRDDFIDPLRAQCKKIYVIAGNHDCFYRNTISLNSLRELLSDEHETIIDAPTELPIDETGKKALFLPWITDENRSDCTKAIQNASGSLVFGHLELSGFQMYPGSVCEDGDDPGALKRFQRVFTGHFHTRSSAGNIHYLGAPFEFTWGDAGDARGFHIYDTETDQLEFIANPHSMFRQLTYDDRASKPSVPTDCQNGYIRIVVEAKENPTEFNRYLADIEAQKPIDIKIIETCKIVTDDQMGFKGTETTEEIIRKYIEQSDVPVDKTILQARLMDVYGEAIRIV